MYRVPAATPEVRVTVNRIVIDANVTPLDLVDIETALKAAVTRSIDRARVRGDGIDAMLARPVLSNAVGEALRRLASDV